MAGPPISQVFVELLLNQVKFREDLEGARADFARFTTGLRTGLQMLGIATSATGLALWTKQTIDAGAETIRLAQRLNVTTDALQELQYAARTSGVSMQALEIGLRNMNYLLGEASRDSGQALEIFAKLKMEWRDAGGGARNAAEAIGEFADRFNALPTGDQAQISRRLSRGMPEFVNLLKLGGAEIRRLSEEAHKLGMVPSLENLLKLKGAEDAFSRATAAIKNEFMKVVVDAAPAIERMLGGIERLTRGVGDLWSKIREGVTDNRVSNWFQDYFRGKNTLMAEEGGVPGSGAGGAFVPGLLGRLRVEPSDAQREENAIAVSRIKAQAAMAQAVVQEQGARERLSATAIAGLESEIREEEALFEIEKKRMDALRPFELEQKQQWAAKAERAKLEAEHNIKMGALTEKLTQAYQAMGRAWIYYPGPSQPIEDATAKYNKSMEDAALAQDLFGESADALDQKLQTQKTFLLAVAAAGDRYSGLFKKIQADIAETEAQIAERGSSKWTLWGGGGPTSPQETATKRYQETLRDLDAEYDAFGTSNDYLQRKLDATRAAMLDLSRAGDRYSETFLGYETSARGLEMVVGVVNQVHAAFASVGNAVSTTIQGIMLGTQTAAQAFANMGRNIAASLIENVINQGLKQVEKAVIAFITELQKTGLLSAAIKTGLNALLGIGAATAPAAAPAAAPATGGSFYWSPTMGQHGGIITHPTNLIAGEAGPEALIPLTSHGPLVQITISNQHPTADVSERTSYTGTGTELHDIVIREVRRAAGNGELEGVLKPYAMRRVPTGR